MSSTQQDSSIASSSIFIPNWVKNKLENSGFDPSALSPPTHDSEFFYVKFPKSDKTEASQKLGGGGGERPRPHISRPFIPIANEPVRANILKAMGVEEGIGSVMSVAQHIVSGGNRSPVRGFTTDDANEKPSGTYLSKRRNSKSLPSSPLTSPETSPRTRRKNATAFALNNRFPVGSLAAATLVEGDEIAEKKTKSWILSGLFSQSRESGLTVKNTENSVAAEGRTNNESQGLPGRANLNVTVDVKSSSIPSPPIIDKKVYLKKRSEIRELNFMSPVSM